MNKQKIKIIKRNKEILNFETSFDLEGVYCSDGMVRIDCDSGSVYIPIDLVECIKVEEVE